jgi:hypothetical protein
MAAVRARASRAAVRPRPSRPSPRVPVDISIAEGQRAPGGVPRHPAILEAIEHKGTRAAAQSFVEPATKIVEHDRSELAVARVRKPDAAGNVEARLVPPDDIGGQILGFRRLGQDVDERRVAGAPHRRSLVGRQHARALEAQGRRRPVVALPIGIGLRRRRALRMSGRSCEREGKDNERADKRRRGHPSRRRALARLLRMRFGRERRA